MAWLGLACRPGSPTFRMGSLEVDLESEAAPGLLS